MMINWLKLIILYINQSINLIIHPYFYDLCMLRESVDGQSHDECLDRPGIDSLEEYMGFGSSATAYSWCLLF